ncbi:MAG: hypothetical protein AAFP84_17920 [Actinomycetota bacterium]
MTAAAPLDVDGRPAVEATGPMPYGPVDRCPVCDTDQIRPAVGDGQCAFRCDDCGIRWSYALGHLIVR